MSVTIRRRRLSDGSTKLFIDIYNKGRRKFEFTELVLGKDRQHNKIMLAIAEQLRNKIELEVLSDKYDFSNQQPDKDFFQFAQELISFKEQGNRRIFDHTIKHLQQFIGGKTLSFGELTPTFCSKFVAYLKTSNLKQGTQWMYFQKLKHILKGAHSQELISKNPCAGIRVQLGQSSPRFLILDELTQLVKTPCRHESVRNAFLFSCLTGLRYGDIIRLKWKDIFDNRIVLKQKKTGTMVSIPLCPSALRILDSLEQVSENIFQLPHFRTVNRALNDWGKEAGVELKISTHTGRHTYATILLNSGADVTTVSKLLGHAGIKQTLTYAKVLDSTLTRAVNLLPEIGQ